jgi:hypothetical protein
MSARSPDDTGPVLQRTWVFERSRFRGRIGGKADVTFCGAYVCL